MEYDEIKGQKKIKDQLISAVATGKVSHAYIFNGHGHCGKLDMARIFARALLCEKGTGRPCGQCHSCKQALSDSHPDILQLVITGKSGISVSDIRTQVCDSIVVKPFSAERKVYIIPEAHRMNAVAQNALLKTLEEPPAYAVIILVTDNHEVLLPTVRSRCVRLDFETTLEFECGEIAVSLVKNIGSRAIDTIIRSLENIEDHKDKKDDILDAMLVWYRDAMIYKSTGRTEGFVFADEAEAVCREADRLDYGELFAASGKIENARRRINANVKMKNVMEALLLDLRGAGR